MLIRSITSTTQQQRFEEALLRGREVVRQIVWRDPEGFYRFARQCDGGQGVVQSQLRKMIATTTSTTATRTARPLDLGPICDPPVTLLSMVATRQRRGA